MYFIKIIQNFNQINKIYINKTKLILEVLIKQYNQSCQTPDKAYRLV